MNLHLSYISNSFLSKIFICGVFIRPLLKKIPCNKNAGLHYYIWNTCICWELVEFTQVGPRLQTRPSPLNVPSADGCAFLQGSALLRPTKL